MTVDDSHPANSDLNNNRYEVSARLSVIHIEPRRLDVAALTRSVSSILNDSVMPPGEPVRVAVQCGFSQDENGCLPKYPFPVGDSSEVNRGPFPPVVFPFALTGPDLILWLLLGTNVNVLLRLV